MHGVHVDRVQFPAPRQVKRGGVEQANFLRLGLVAHLVERCIRIAEVRGSSPLKSTNNKLAKLCLDNLLFIMDSNWLEARRVYFGRNNKRTSAGRISGGYSDANPGQVSFSQFWRKASAKVPSSPQTLDVSEII